MVEIKDESVTISSGAVSCEIKSDENTGKVTIRIGNYQSRLEIDAATASISLLNDSDIGLQVDDSGLTKIQHLAVIGQAKFNAGQPYEIEIDATGDIEIKSNLKGPILHSRPGNISYRIKVDDQGNVGSELVV